MYMNNTTSPEKVNESLVEPALEYQKMGFFILPLRPGDKRPFVGWKNRRDKRPDEKEIKSWWSKFPDAQIGIATGKYSGVDVVDFDNSSVSMPHFEAVVSDIPDTFSVTSGRADGGQHVYFKHNSHAFKNIVKPKDKYGQPIDVDLRTTGGIIVAPPSVHKSGKIYQWGDLNPLDMDDWHDELQEMPKTMATFFETASGNNNKPGDESVNLDISEILSGINKGERDILLFKYACRLRGKDIEYEEAKIIIIEIAANCTPAFSKKEAIKKLDQAWNYEPGFKEQERVGRDSITYLSAADVLAEPVEIDWIIIGLMATDESCLIHSKGGLGKSMFTLYLALLLASVKKTDIDALLNGCFGMNQFIVPKSRAVLFIGAENGRITTYQRLKKMCTANPELEDGLKFIFFLSKYNDTTITGEFFNDESFCDFLVDFIQNLEQEQDVKIEILIIDPLISFSGVKNENDNGEMRPALDALDSACKRIKCTPIVIHHDKKDGNGYRGSSAIADWCRNRIGLSREWIPEQRATEVDATGKPTKFRVQKIPVVRVSHRKCNNFQMFDPFLLRMTQDLHFEHVPEQLSPEQQEKANLVVQSLTDLGGRAESTNTLAKTYGELSGKSQTTAKRHINLAVENNLINRESVLVDGKQTYEYCLKN